MNSLQMLTRLATVDTLLGLGGIIPSLSEFQSRLIGMMNDYTRALCDEGVTKEDVDALCRVACAWLDHTAESALTRSWLTWKNYALESYFYDAPRDGAFYTTSLAGVLHSAHESVRASATSLVLLLSDTRLCDADLAALRAQIPAPAPGLAHQGMPENTAEETIRLSPEPPITASVAFDYLIFIALIAALWRCCAHFLNAWYQCLF